MNVNKQTNQNNLPLIKNYTFLSVREIYYHYFDKKSNLNGVEVEQVDKYLRLE